MDLIGALKLPVIVVGRAGLGGINHALLTVDALRRRRLPLVALVLNRTEPVRSAIMRLQERTTVEALRRRAGVPVIGPLPYEPNLAKSYRRSVIRLTRTAAITALARLVTAAVR
jgi:dethiobiotin synthetase